MLFLSLQTLHKFLWYLKGSRRPRERPNCHLLCCPLPPHDRCPLWYAHNFFFCCCCYIQHLRGTRRRQRTWCVPAFVTLEPILPRVNPCLKTTLTTRTITIRIRWRRPCSSLAHQRLAPRHTISPLTRVAHKQKPCLCFIVPPFP